MSQRIIFSRKLRDLNRLIDNIVFRVYNAKIKLTNQMYMTRREKEPIRTTNFGRRIREARREQGLKITELAEKSGISQSHISHIERGFIVHPGNEIMESLVDALGINSEDTMERGKHDIEQVSSIEAKDISRQISALYQEVGEIRKIMEERTLMPRSAHLSGEIIFEHGAKGIASPPIEESERPPTSAWQSPPKFKTRTVQHN